MPAYTAYCVNCHHALNPAWAFCPYCGEDNRPPEKRSGIPPHAHDFSKGYHCIYCGESYANVGKKEPVHGLIYKNYSLRYYFWVAAFFCLVFMFPRRGLFEPSAGAPYFIGSASLFFLLGILVLRKVMVDIDKREVRELMGIWPFLKLKVYPFNEIRAVIAGVRISYGRYSSYRSYFPIRIMANTTLIDVKEFRDSSYASGVGQQIAATIGVPFQNEMGNAYWQPGWNSWW